MSPFQFKETLVGWALLWGNGFAEIERDGAGRLLNLWPIEPWRVRIYRDDDSNLFYRVNNGTAPPIDLAASDVFHIRGFGNGPVGLSVVEYAAQTIGWQQATELFGATYFGEGMHFSGAVQLKGRGSPPGIRRMREELEEQHKGVARSNRWVFLDNDATLTKMSASPNEAQFLETAQFQVEEICFVPGTEIVTPTGLRAIETLKVGDLVLTHRGRWRPVTQVMSRSYVGEVVRVRAKGLREVRGTTNHPFYAVPMKLDRSHRLQAEPAMWIEAGALEPMIRMANGRRGRRACHALVMPRLSDEGGCNGLDLRRWAPETAVVAMGRTPDYVYFGIDEAVRERYAGTVHNISVEEDESYTTEGGTVHNCRWFGVPPQKVMHLLRMTFNNVEQLAIEVVQDAITPWAIRIEEEGTWKLFGANRQNLFLKLDLKGLLRGDFQTRQTGLQILRRNGVINANQWADIEDMPRVGPDGDKYIIEGNMTTLAAVGTQPTSAMKPQLPAPEEPGSGQPKQPSEDPAVAAIKQLAWQGLHAHAS
jgi:phage portal protein BeeE